MISKIANYIVVVFIIALSSAVVAYSINCVCQLHKSYKMVAETFFPFGALYFANETDYFSFSYFDLSFKSIMT